MKNILIIISALFVVAGAAYAVKVYPNPWIPDSKGGSHGDYKGVNFDGLSNKGGTTYIHNATGELVRKLSWPEGEISVKWNGRNDRGEYVASGVYIWVVNDGGTKSGKVVVIR